MITFRKLGKVGRFGNQLFQYAGTRLYAEKHGFDWAFPDWDGNRLFTGITNDECLMPNKVSRFFIPTVQLTDMTATSWDERLLRPFGLWRRSSLERLYTEPEDNISLYGYLQEDFDIRKLRENRGRIREWFRFRHDIEQDFRKATDKYRPWLAVHLRFGDMVKRGVASNIDDALVRVERLQRERNLFVATDTAAVREQLKDRCPIGPENPRSDLPPYAFDFWILKEADVLIGSGSTFAWWAAFLSRKESYWSPPLNRTWQGQIPPITEQRI